MVFLSQDLNQIERHLLSLHIVTKQCKVAELLLAGSALVQIELGIILHYVMHVDTLDFTVVTLVLIRETGIARPSLPLNFDDISLSQLLQPC